MTAPARNMPQRFAILLTIGLSACIFLSKQQSIDLDVNHWDHYAISERTINRLVCPAPSSNM